MQARSSRISRYRLLTFLAGFAAGIIIYYSFSNAIGWSVWGLTFIVLNIQAFVHRRIDASIDKHAIWLELKSAQVARMLLDWQNVPLPQVSQADEEHAFGIDLDLTGSRSLHQLLDTAISRDGSLRLQNWLLQPKLDIEGIVTRQKVLRELTPLARFRDKLHLAYKLISKEQLEGKELLHFLKKPQSTNTLKWVLLTSAVLAATNIVLFLLSTFGLIGAYWWITLLVYGTVYFLNQQPLESLMNESVFITEELRKFRAVLHFLERQRYGDNTNLAHLCEPFWQHGTRPTEELRTLTLLGLAIGLRMNPLFRIALNVVMPWDFLFAYVHNRHKVHMGAKVERWLEVLTELEALASLANFAYLNPEAAFPEIVPNDAEVILQTQALGHPLIPDEVRKCNDFAFDAIGEVALITGSNMSGKSTFLKTLGVNLVLAYTGAPVVASDMQTRLFRLYTCIKINDSIADGFSFFYAEVRRLKAILDALRDENSLPLMFLIDEIFKGTNNRERLLGSQSYIKSLTGHHGLGAITTHDLELTQLAETIPEVINYHFREDVVDGKMVFDYKMRPGPCPSTNALKIMRLEGLPVDD